MIRVSMHSHHAYGCRRVPLRRTSRNTRPDDSVRPVHSSELPRAVSPCGRGTGASPQHTVVALGEAENVKHRQRIPGVKLWATAPRAGSRSTIRSCAAGSRRQARRADRPRLRGPETPGFTPHLICAHPGWGEALFLKDVFPQAHLQLYAEFFYRGQGAMSVRSGAPVEPAGPVPRAHQERFHAASAWKRATAPSPYAVAEAGVSAPISPCIKVAHEGVNTDIVKPDAGARLDVGDGLTLTPEDEVITYVARNLEPYRGFHVFMRAVAGDTASPAAGENSRGRRRWRELWRALTSRADYRQKMLDELGAAIDATRIHFLGPYLTARWCASIRCLQRTSI